MNSQILKFFEHQTVEFQTLKFIENDESLLEEAPKYELLAPSRCPGYSKQPDRSAEQEAPPGSLQQPLRSVQGSLM